LLPRHRGNSAINWAIMWGEPKTGLSIFWTDRGIDTGPILLQREVEIGADDTTGSLYFNKLFPIGVEAMVEAVKMVRLGTAPRIEQDEWQATYERPCRDEEGQIDWSRPAGETYNQIRACNPQPGAWTLRNGENLKIFECERGPAAELATKPGEVLAIGPDGVDIALPRATLRLKRVQAAGGAKIAAVQYATDSRLEIGDALGG
jgi:methionyl-tRNA formyltransferase